MKRENTASAEELINGWCGYLFGGKVSRASPKRLGCPGEWDEECWCYMEVESALEGEDGNLRGYLKASYWLFEDLGGESKRITDAFVAKLRARKVTRPKFFEVA